MRLGLSNLALPASEEAALLPRLREWGVAGIEVAPTRLAPWEAIDASLLRRIHRRVAETGLAIGSLQAIFYGRPALQLLGEPAAFAAMAAHLDRVGEIAAALDAAIAVFGAPANRRRGALAPEAAFALGRDRLRVLAERAAGAGIVLGLEPVAATYGADFLTTPPEVLAMVRAVDHPGLRVHLDTGCAVLEGQSIAAAIHAAGPLLCHFHVSEPQLAGFGAPIAEHKAAATALRDAGYAGWVTIEMREPPADAPAAIAQAVAAVRSLYGIA